MDDTLKIDALLAGVNSKAGKTGRLGYYVSVLVGGQPATFYTQNPPAILNKLVKSEINDKVMVPDNNDDVLPVRLIVGVRYYKGEPSLDLLRVEER